MDSPGFNQSEAAKNPKARGVEEDVSVLQSLLTPSQLKDLEQKRKCKRNGKNQDERMVWGRCWDGVGGLLQVIDYF